MSYSPERRLWVLFGGICLLFGVITFRLIEIQIVKASYYEAVAVGQRMRASELMPSRGTIYMSEKGGQDVFPVASNRRAWSVFAVPRDMDDPQEVVDKLAPELLAFRHRQRQRTEKIIIRTGQASQAARRNTEASEVEEDRDELEVIREMLWNRFNRKTALYAPILRRHEFLDEEFKEFLDNNELKGVILEEREMRVYPETTLAAHVLGYVGWSDEKQVGRYGIEGFFDEKLAGNLGWMNTERDIVGRFIGVGDREFNPAEDGADVVLSIDRVVQSFIEEELRDGVERYAADRGSIVVMDPKDGRILGMATYPTFDLNYYYAINDPSVQANPVISDLFEPGSIFKPIVMAGALDAGIVRPDTTFVDDGPVKVDRFTIDNYDRRHHGLQTMTQIMEKSNNVGMVWVAQKMGAEMMYDSFRRFGVGERTGIELQGETQSTLPEPRQWNVATVATNSFGQGVVMSPLQALNAINAIANGGHLMQPSVISKVKYSDGRESVFKPDTVRQVVSTTTANQVAAMMVNVIENGSGQSARIPGYYLAGKTGTAQVADSSGGYSKDKKIISFVGFGPVENPAFSIIVKLDNPAGLSFASGTAAPMFRNISEKLLNYYQIPPDYDPSDPAVSRGINF